MIYGILCIKFYRIYIHIPNHILCYIFYIISIVERSLLPALMLAVDARRYLNKLQGTGKPVLPLVVKVLF